MKKARLLILLVLICIVLAACGIGAPNKQQIESDLMVSGIVNFPIEKVEITETLGDKNDYRASVSLSGSEGVLSYTARGYVKYRRMNGRWSLYDCDLSSDVRATLNRTPTEQEILSGFSGLASLEFYLPYKSYWTYGGDRYNLTSSGLDLNSQFENISVSDVEIEPSVYGSESVRFTVSCTEIYGGVRVDEIHSMKYSYDAEENGWYISNGNVTCSRIDYSGLIGRKITGSGIEGYIVDFSENGFAMELNGRRFDYTISEDFRDLSKQFEQLQPEFYEKVIDYDKAHTSKLVKNNVELGVYGVRFSFRGKRFYLTSDYLTPFLLYISD